MGTTVTRVPFSRNRQIVAYKRKRKKNVREYVHVVFFYSSYVYVVHPTGMSERIGIDGGSKYSLLFLKKKKKNPIIEKRF